MSKKVYIAGAGLFGLTLAERISKTLRKSVILVDKRNHIGGNAYSFTDAKTGIDVHQYGSHIFHTSIDRVWKYANLYTSFNNYVHRVWTVHNQEVFPMPINLGTINQFFRTNYSPQQAMNEIKKQAGKFANIEPKNLDEQGKKLIGEPLFNAFIKNYTAKQWQTDPKDLDASIITRLPVRYNYNNRYFNDKYEGIPADGYGNWFENMVNNPLIKIVLNNDFLSEDALINRHNIEPDSLVIFTGPIDKYYEFSKGVLGWRTIDFKTETLNIDDFQGTSVMNYADLDDQFTRIIEYKHFMPEHYERSKGKTIVSYEFSRSANKDDAPYYPVNTAEDKAILAEYKKLASNEENVIFGGRLGNYTYYDMDKVIDSALTLFETTVKERLK